MYVRITEGLEYTGMPRAAPSKSTKARHCRRNAKARTVGHHAWWRRLCGEAIPLRQHQPATKAWFDEGPLSFLLLLFALLLRSFLDLLLQRGELLDHRARALDLVGHIEVVEAVLPGQFFHDIGAQEVEATKQGSSEAFLVPDIDEVREKVFSYFGGIGTGGSHDRILVELVLLGQCDRLLPLALFLRSKISWVCGAKSWGLPCKGEQPIV